MSSKEAMTRKDDQAFAYPADKFAQGSYYLNYLKLDPELDNLRTDPRFAELLQPVLNSSRKTHG